MAENMMGGIDPEKLKSVLDAQDTARDALVSSQAPVGRFSKPRMDATAKVVMKALGLIKAPHTIEPPQAGPNNKPFPLPVDLVKGLTIVKSMIDKYNESNPDMPLKSFEISGMTSDADLALVGMAIDGLLKSRDFKDFLKEQAPEGEMEVEMSFGGEEGPGMGMEEMGSSSPEMELSMLK